MDTEHKSQGCLTQLYFVLSCLSFIILSRDLLSSTKKKCLPRKFEALLNYFPSTIQQFFPLTSATSKSRNVLQFRQTPGQATCFCSGDTNNYSASPQTRLENDPLSLMITTGVYSAGGTRGIQKQELFVCCSPAYMQGHTGSSLKA